MNSRHREERRNARKKMKKFNKQRNTRKIFENQREKESVLGNDETCLFDTYSMQKVTENKKAIKSKR